MRVHGDLHVVQWSSGLSDKLLGLITLKYEMTFGSSLVRLLHFDERH